MNRKAFRLLLGFLVTVFVLTSVNSVSTAQVETLPPLKIVHLGDSYSAGNGARSETGGPDYVGIQGCYRSPNNWGSQFAESLGDTYTVNYINRACSGAVTSDILSPKFMDYTDTFLGSCPSVEYYDEEYNELDTADPTRCIRKLHPQIWAIDKSVDLVVMTMGGNDLKFDQIVLECFVPGKGRDNRDPAGCFAAVDFARTELEIVERQLIDSFAEIRARLSDEAKVVFVTYPYITLLDNGYRLIDSDTGFTYAPTSEIRDLGLEGDQRQRNAVATANRNARELYKTTEDFIVFYDGTKALFAGHEPNPDVLGWNANGWIHELVIGVQAESYHPNALGHENWGRALSYFEAFGAVGGSFVTNSDIDVAFVVDTTGSMGGEIAQVRADLSQLVAQLEETTDSYKVAVVSYRDFPERTGDNQDYPFKVIQEFTEDPVSIQAAINSLTLGNGGDGPETVFSGIQSAIELSWRPGVTKIAIVIGDAPALSPEPISNLTAAQIIANSIAVDPVQVIGVDTGSLNSNGAMGLIAEGTGGSIVLGTSGLTTKISEILDSAVKQPFAWVGQAYSGKIGYPILFDASGSYDPSGAPIALYEWDFNSDGIFDLSTDVPTATHTYDAAFNDYVVLRVTSEGGTALASARTVVNEEGFASQGDEKSCELDEYGYSIILDEEGRFIRCTPTNFPLIDREGISEVSGKSLLFLPMVIH